MKKKELPAPSENIDSVIQTIRGQKVILDADLARIYGVSTKRLNEQFRRNLGRFPADFAFQLTEGEKAEVVANCDHLRQLKFSHVLPWAFTENGAIMAASILNSPEAVRMSVFVVRAFVKMRELLAGTDDLARQLKELEAKLTARLDVHETVIVEVLQRVMDALTPPPPEPEPPRREIGFHAPPDEQNTGVNRSKKAFAGRRKESKAEEKALEEARSARLPFKRAR